MTLIFLTFFSLFISLFRRQITNSPVPDVVDWSSCDYPYPYLCAGTLGTKTIPAEFVAKLNSNKSDEEIYHHCKYILSRELVKIIIIFGVRSLKKNPKSSFSEVSLQRKSNYSTNQNRCKKIKRAAPKPEQINGANTERGKTS